MKRASLSDFTVGQEVWVQRKGPSARKVSNNIPALLYPTKVEKIGRKYVVAGGRKFSEPDEYSSYTGLVESSTFGIENVLYPSYEAVLNRFEVTNNLRSLVDELSNANAANIDPASLRAACEALGVSYKNHTLSEGYMDVDTCIDSFTKGGAWSDMGLPYDFPVYAKSCMRGSFTEEEVKTMDENDVYDACKAFARRYQRSIEIETTSEEIEDCVER